MKKDDKIVLQKYMADAGIGSRRKCQEMIALGKVKINGRLAELGAKVSPRVDIITVDGQRIEFSKVEKYYIMLYKPRGFVTTMSDEYGRKCVAELVKDIPGRIYPVGRLDKDSEGLLLMTNDGDFANQVMHPSHNVSKTYLTWVTGEDIGLAMEYLRCPMDIDGYIISPAEVELYELYNNGAVLSIAIHEGRNRQVRKMCETAGLKVKRLLRISEGALQLGELKSGTWRHLSQEELELVRSCREN